MSYLVLSNRKSQATLRVTISRNRRDPPPTDFQVDAAALKCSRRQVSHTHTTTAHHTLPFPIPFLSSLRPPLAALPLPPPPPPGWPRATPTSPWRSPPAASARGSPRPWRSARSSRRPTRTRRPAQWRTRRGDGETAARRRLLLARMGNRGGGGGASAAAASTGGVGERVRAGEQVLPCGRSSLCSLISPALLSSYAPNLPRARCFPRPFSHARVCHPRMAPALLDFDESDAKSTTFGRHGSKADAIPI